MMVSKKELEDLERRAHKAIEEGREGVVVIPKRVVLIREDEERKRVAKKSV